MHPAVTDSAAIVFDGYRGSGLAPEAIASFLAANDMSRVDHLNRRDGCETLADRAVRATRWLADSPAERLLVLGLSMGCQLAVQFSEAALLEGRRVDLLVLVAPDPKFDENGRDRLERGRFGVSAFDEALELWPHARSAGPRFTDALGRVASHPGTAATTIVVSRTDPVAVWPGNVEVMYRDLTGSSGVRWIEAAAGETVGDGTTTVTIAAEEDVHTALGQRIRFG